MTRSLRFLMAALAAIALVVGVTACGSDEDDGGGGSGSGSSANLIKKNSDNASKKVTIGSKNFPEQFILGEIYSQALEAAGYKVTKKLNLGSEQIAFKALKSGQIDGYPEYTGTSLTNFFGVKTKDVPRDPDKAYDQVKSEYSKLGISALPRTKFNNTYIIASTSKDQKGKFKGAKTVSDLAKLPNRDSYKIAGFPECRQRTDCLLGLKIVYDGWKPKFLSTQAKYEPLERGQSDLSFAFATDGDLTLDKFATYKDDKRLFPPYNISFGIKSSKLKELGPDAEKVVTDVQKGMTTENMRELISRVDLKKEKPKKVAADYLSELGFIK